MSKFLLVGAEHLNALQEQVIWGLAGAATYVAYGDMAEKPWLDIEGLAPPERSGPRDNFVGNLYQKLREEKIQDRASPYGFLLKLRISRPAREYYNEYNFGRVRGGGGEAPGDSGWTRGPEFILRSGLVFTLGALEEFERDVLKILLKYRPAGQPRKPLEGVIEASTDDLESDPPLWAYLDKPAENQIERQKIFSRIFGFEPYSLREELKDFYDIRNEIAHGRSPTLVTLSKFARCTEVAFLCMRHLSDEAQSKQFVMI